MKTNYVKEAVVLVAGLLLGVLLAHVSAPSAPLAGGTQTSLNQPTFTNGYSVGALPVDVNWSGGKMGVTANQAFWRNTTGQSVVVDYADITTDGMASTSFKEYVAISTTTAFANDFVAPTASTTLLINGFLISTSSVATTTSSLSGSAGSRTILVPDGQYVVFQLQAANGTVCSLLRTCETATSSNRGFNMQWRLRYHN